MVDRKEIFKKRLGKKIASLRHKKGLTQSELAAFCGGRDKQSISRLENGRVNPEVYTLVEIAEVFEITLSQLLDFDYKSTKEPIF